MSFASDEYPNFFPTLGGILIIFVAVQLLAGILEAGGIRVTEEFIRRIMLFVVVYAFA